MSLIRGVKGDGVFTKDAASSELATMFTDFKIFSGRRAEIFRKTLTLLIISIPKKLCIDLQLLERTHNKSKVCLHTAT